MSAPVFALDAPLPGFDMPRLSARGFLDWILARDLLCRERAELAGLGAEALGDIGASRADIDRALADPESHFGSILARGGH